MTRADEFVKELKALLKKYDASMNLEDECLQTGYTPPDKIINVDFGEWILGEPSFIELGKWIEGDDK